ncbi:hypothetical protein SAMN04488030_3175 [Aliiroseovarius halocynthiae]|nr:hypothetical protein SAMN04488030_3175 [Aliiroseovarius halocynthiae]
MQGRVLLFGITRNCVYEPPHARPSGALERIAAANLAWYTAAYHRHFQRPDDSFVLG